MNESMTDCREGRKELYSSVRHPGMELSGVTFILLWQMGSRISTKRQWSCCKGTRGSGVTPNSLSDFTAEGPIQRVPTIPNHPAHRCLTEANGNPKVSKNRAVPTLQIIFWKLVLLLLLFTEGTFLWYRWAHFTFGFKWKLKSICSLCKITLFTGKLSSCRQGPQ